MDENTKKKESFVFYRSFADSINYLPANLQLPLYKAITAYALDLEVPDFGNYEDKFVLEALWAGIKPQLDANYQRYLNGCKGGAPKGSRNNPNGRRGKGTNQELTENKSNDNVNVNDNVNEGAGGHRPAPRPKKTFVIPTLQEVQEYCAIRGNNVDAAKFVSHYESIGRKIGKAPMKNWQAAVRTWERNEQGNAPARSPRRESRVISKEDMI